MPAADHRNDSTLKRHINKIEKKNGVVKRLQKQFFRATFYSLVGTSRVKAGVVTPPTCTPFETGSDDGR